MKINLSKILLMLCLGIVQLSANTSRAEDIDIFAGVVTAASAPTMLIVLDNAANFSSNAAAGASDNCTAVINGVSTTFTTAMSGTVGGIEQCALYNVINSLVVTSTATLKLGIMVYKAGNVVDYLGNACTGTNNAGGCVVYPVTGITTATKPVLLAWIRSWKTSGSGAGYIKANNQATAAAMQEAWAYLQGKTGLSGTDYTMSASACLKTVVVFIGNSYSSSGSPGDSSGDSGPMNALNGTNSTAGMNASPAPSPRPVSVITNTSVDSNTSCGTVSFPSNHENSGYYLDEWAFYMASRSITTYTIGVLGATCKAEYAWLLDSAARTGGGKYFPTTSYAGLKSAFDTIFSEVQAVNTVFASVSLPVSVNTQGTYLNQVFIGMFRPDEKSFPRWSGNLKQYKMGKIGGELKMLDAADAAAININTGFIAECARSFWTPGLLAADTYWNLYAVPNCVGYASSSNTPDGSVVEKGGSAYMLRAKTPSSRVVKTCSSTFASCATSSPGLTNFNTANAAITLAGTDATVVTKDILIDWARGKNSKVTDEEATVASTAMRPSVHGDVVHSRPVAINFGTDALPKVVVFYGANDGALRAINGNRPNGTTSTFTLDGTSVAAGDEGWAFVPPEFYANFKRLYDNTARIRMLDASGTPRVAGTTAKNYGIDGTVTAYRAANGDAWVYATMRRGGRAVYAFKVDGSTMAITLKWKRGCDGSTCSDSVTFGDFSNIGQTWAAPKVIFASGYGSGTAPLLVMGGGYDATCEDALNYSCTSTTGNRIYVMDADTGILQKTFNTVRPVVGDIVFIRDSSGKATYGYAADMGGNIYRISGATAITPIGVTAPSLWTSTQIASLGCATAATCTSPGNRKFLFGPDVVVDGEKNILLIGSGDREKPLNTSNTTSNYYFKIDDMPALTTYLSSESVANCTGVSMLCLASLQPVVAGTVSTIPSTKKGWYLALDANEQVVTSGVTVFGVSYFSTNKPVTPNPNSCSANLGSSKAYAVSYVNGANPNGTNAVPFTYLPQGGLPPSPVAGKVTLDDGTTVPFIIGAKGPLETMQLINTNSAKVSTKVRSYWFIQK